MNYSSKENVNILTALLVAHGIRHVVVCPGSRNAPLVHNFDICPDLHCYPVTDERSAGFCALGMTDVLQRPVAVCVTSGSALLNLAPAVAEAFYRHRPLIVISADRPAAWIDQLDGQTLPQPGAFSHFVARTVSLPEPHDEEEHWYCNRMVNEALLSVDAPVHINVPISEPLFDFTVTELPHERVIERVDAEMTDSVLRHIGCAFMAAKRPMLISGQPMNPHLDEAVILAGNDPEMVPDLVVYTGGSIVSKRVKRFLRQARETWIVTNHGEVADPLMNVTRVIAGDGAQVANHLYNLLSQQSHPFVEKWNNLLRQVAKRSEAYQPAYSQMEAVRLMETRLQSLPVVYRHYANSTAIRLANIYAHGTVFCNRGVNGIEGSLSTAAGHALAAPSIPVCCVIGDLSFFYDQNALWNTSLQGNLRILLLNNSGGGIFRMLPGLEKSQARDRLVSACHQTSAEGICRQNHLAYRSIADEASLPEALDWLLTTESRRPVVLEVVTDAACDEQVYRHYLQLFEAEK